jgi:hypothetical protein
MIVLQSACSSVPVLQSVPCRPPAIIPPELAVPARSPEAISKLNDYSKPSSMPARQMPEN